MRKYEVIFSHLFAATGIPFQFSVYLFLIFIIYAHIQVHQAIYVCACACVWLHYLFISFFLR